VFGLFFESLVLGLVLALALGAGRSLLRQAPARRVHALPAGQALRCVRPLDPGGR
jgi:hypothetical protein